MTDAISLQQLSKGQRAMWFLWNLNPDGAEYGLPMAWTIAAPLDAAALQAALQGLVDRHPALRTTYAAPKGEPVQIIHARQAVAFTTVDASGWPASFLHDQLTSTAAQPFDLAHGPIFRSHLFCGGAAGHVLLLNCHHIAGDTWSLIVMMEELGALYHAHVAGTDAVLPPGTAPYTDYVAWQKALLASPHGDAHWDYWRTQLAAPPTLGLPTDRPRVPVQRHHGAGQPFTLDAALTAQVRALARHEGVTLYTVLLAAFYALLHRYTGQDDLIVGSPRFGRPPEGFERTVGYFASPCALRARIDGKANFAGLLREVRAVLDGSKDHQDFPFPLIVERLGLPRDPSRGPVFQVAFTYQKAQLAHMQGVAAARMGTGGVRLHLGDLTLTSYPLEQKSVRFDLDLVVEEVDGCLRAMCWYNTDLWNGDSVAYLTGHYQALLAAAVHTPLLPIERLPMLSRQEDAALAAWNATAAPFPRTDEIERKVAAIFADVLGLDVAHPCDSFFDLGGTSLSALSVLISLEQLAGHELPNAMLIEHPTVAGLARALRAGARSVDARLIELHAAGSGTPIFCVHPYGGHTTGYIALARHLGPDQPVYGIQARGLQGEAAPLHSIEAMAQDYIGLVKARQPAGPYRLAGHSMGGCIAYEMARQLTQSGESIALLALFDSRAQNASDAALFRNSAYGRMASRDWVSDDGVLLGILFPQLDLDWDALRAVAPEQHWQLALKGIVQQGLLPPGTAMAQVQQLLTVTRANDAALRSYHPQPYAGDMLLFLGSEGFAAQFGEPDLGWQALVRGSLEITTVPGTHHTIMTGTSAQMMATRMLHV